MSRNYKSRGNYFVKICLKSDCLSRGKKCKDCIRFSEYNPYISSWEYFLGIERQADKNEKLK